MKFLVIRFSSIGDIVLTTPVVRCLRKAYPDAEIHYLSKVQFKRIIEYNPNIDKFIYLDDSFFKTIKYLRKEEYDVIIDLHHNLRTFLIKAFLFTKSFSFDKLNFEKWLYANFRINKLPKKHIVERLMETVEPLEVKYDGKGLDYFITHVDQVDLKLFPPTHRSGYIAFAIGGTYKTKKLPKHQIIELCRNIDKPVVLIGGESEVKAAKYIEKKVGEKVYNACNTFNLNQSASIIQQADAVLTHDTGMMHIAAAYHKKILSVWGNTVPEFGMGPYFGTDLSAEEQKTAEASKIFEVLNLKCRPCSKIGFNECPKGHFKCMNLIDVKEIAVNVNQD